MREVRIAVLVLLAVLCCPTRGAASSLCARSGPLLHRATAERSGRGQRKAVAAVSSDPLPAGNDPGPRVLGVDSAPLPYPSSRPLAFHPAAVALTGVVVQRR